MKAAYTFVTLRYVHDVVTGEFANVGVVLYAPEARHLEARFTTSYERLNALFLKIDHANYRNLIRYLDNRFVELAAEIRNEQSSKAVQAVEELVRRVLPKDDSSLQWSPPGGGFSSDLAETSRQLYARMVERYLHSGDVAGRNDEEIVKPFKARLKKVAEKLQVKRIAAKDFDYKFNYAWKNAIWHLYEPVSFDLVDPDSIKDKANRWLGRGVALNDTSERFKIHFLLGEPKQPGTEKAFESAKHLLEKIPGQKELVRESELEAFADSVAVEMANHP
jgi:hypothetical protein